HRGRQLKTQPGNSRQLVCGFHGWTWNLDGSLARIPCRWDFPQISDEDNRLPEVRCETWSQFVFVNFDDDAPSIASQLSETAKWGGDRYRMDRMVTSHRWEYHVECNWKAYVDNFTESYHVPWVHPETFELLTPLKRWVEFPEITDQPWALQVGQTPGLTFSDSGDALFTVSPELERLPVEFDGMPVWLVFPTLMVIPTVDCVLYYVAFPEGPEQTRIRIGMAFPPDAAAAHLAGDDPQATAAVEEYVGNAKLFLEEDNVICEQQWAGLRSHRGAAGRYCEHEGLVRRFDKWVADRAYGPAS
ncbi:MAG TPA: SRPBCC family protein, partial [Solirubrobacteraceae bacterium]|nr:SRPBCC family protein [Solirubrobacteraceae bacterium]